MNAEDPGLVSDIVYSDRQLEAAATELADCAADVAAGWITPSQALSRVLHALRAEEAPGQSDRTSVQSGRAVASQTES